MTSAWAGAHMWTERERKEEEEGGRKVGEMILPNPGKMGEVSQNKTT